MPVSCSPATEGNKESIFKLTLLEQQFSVYYQFQPLFIKILKEPGSMYSSEVSIPEKCPPSVKNYSGALDLLTFRSSAAIGSTFIENSYKDNW